MMVNLPEKAPDWKSIAAKGFKIILKFSNRESQLMDPMMEKFYTPKI